MEITNKKKLMFAYREDSSGDRTKN